MTDYIITEELYLLIRSDLYNNGYIDRYHQLKREVQSRPLHAELQKEREKVLDLIPNIIRDDSECIFRHNGFDYIRLIDVDVAVESLRGKL